MGRQMSDLLWWGRPALVLASRHIQSACVPLVVHILPPLMIRSSPLTSALVWMPYKKKKLLLSECLIKHATLVWATLVWVPDKKPHLSTSPIKEAPYLSENESLITHATLIWMPGKTSPSHQNVDSHLNVASDSKTVLQTCIFYYYRYCTIFEECQVNTQENNDEIHQHLGYINRSGSTVQSQLQIGSKSEAYNHPLPCKSGVVLCAVSVLNPPYNYAILQW